ncbi:MAG TPA: hypothetical protein VM531_11220 [Sphingomicrobium sp.]|jgi:hypothetical protein|nr:hypothetical protein [Sphingomicrobium sp.]
MDKLIADIINRAQVRGQAFHLARVRQNRALQGVVFASIVAVAIIVAMEPCFACCDATRQSCVPGAALCASTTPWYVKFAYELNLWTDLIDDLIFGWWS